MVVRGGPDPPLCKIRWSLSSIDQGLRFDGPPDTLTLKAGTSTVMNMKTYTFKVVVEPDADRWHAYCPALQQYGASTWGYTPEEVLKHINEVVQMISDELREDGIAIPDGPKDEVEVFSDERVAVTV